MPTLLATPSILFQASAILAKTLVLKLKMESAGLAPGPSSLARPEPIPKEMYAFPMDAQGSMPMESAMDVLPLPKKL